MFAQKSAGDRDWTERAGAAAPAAARPRSAATENFPVLSYTVAPRLRAKVAAFYACARAADDVADDPAHTPAGKLAELDRFESGLRGGPGAPEALRLHAACADAPHLLAPPLALLGAFRQDARRASYAGWDDLVSYCEMSAVPVGRFLLALHGEDATASRHADPLCIALQILNHLQDLREDRERLGRVYLPHALLEGAGATEADLSRSALTAPARAAVDAALDRCDALLDTAAPLPSVLRARGLRGQAAATLWLARRLAGRLRGADPLRDRVALSRADFLRAGLAGLRAAARGRR